jgi:hypothetical protein
MQTSLKYGGVYFEHRKVIFEINSDLTSEQDCLALHVLNVVIRLSIIIGQPERDMTEDD